MKSIILSVRSEWVAEILCGWKLVEVRKTLPASDEPLKVYVYCTKSKRGNDGDEAIKHGVFSREAALRTINGRGKVVASFRLLNAEIIDVDPVNGNRYSTEYLTEFGLRDLSCITRDRLHEYLDSKPGYAWYIQGLAIFDKPLELSDFGLTKAPQSWQYLEDNR